MAWPSIYGLDSARLSGQVPVPTKPTILLVHDSFMGPAHFTPLTTELTNAGFRVLCPQLPSCTTAYRPNAIATDIQTVFQSCLPDLYNGRDILMVMSGYGGIVGSVVAARLNEHSLDRPGAGMVTGLMFVSAMVLLENESFSDVLHATSDIYRTSNGLTTLATSERRLLFEPCPPLVLNRAISLLRPQIEECLFAHVPSPGWANIRNLTYIICDADNMWSPEIQLRLAARLRAENANTTLQRLQAGHCPFVTAPQQLASFIVRTAMSGT